MSTKDWVKKNPEKVAAYKRKYYLANAEKIKAASKKFSQELAVWFREYKATLSCIKCGESHPATLDFHHRDPNEKEIGVAQYMRKGWGKNRIMEEVAKCDVLCANCHRKLHAGDKYN